MPIEYVNYVGKGIDCYNEPEPWDNWEERLSSHLACCIVRNENQKRNVLPSTVGAETYGSMKNLLGEERPNTKSYDQLVQLVKEHKYLTPPWQSERIKFLNRDRRKDESVSDYMAVLRKLITTCKYNANEYDTQLRDRLLHGCGDTDMQRAITDVGEQLTLKTAVEAAKLHESKLHSLKEVNTSSIDEQVNAVIYKCWRCRGRHSPEKCFHRNAKCHDCSKVGHLRRCCPGRQRTPDDRTSTRVWNAGPSEDGVRGRRRIGRSTSVTGRGMPHSRHEVQRRGKNTIAEEDISS